MIHTVYNKIRERVSTFSTQFFQDTAGEVPARAHGTHGLSDKLFVEYDRRAADATPASITSTAEDMKQKAIFENGTAIVFAAASHNTINLRIWLETIFGLDVIMVHEPSQFYEWLFRSADLADLVFIDRDSFGDDAPAFGTFMSVAADAFPHSPILGMSREFESSSYDIPNDDQRFDISLKLPLSQTSVWLAMKAAGDITLNGKDQKLVPIALSKSVA